MTQALDAYEGVKVQEDNEIEGILYLGSPSGNRTGEDAVGMFREVLGQKCKALCRRSFVDERRLGLDPKVIVAVKAGAADPCGKRGGKCRRACA